MKPNRRRSSLVRLLTPRGGEAGREAGRPAEPPSPAAELPRSPTHPSCQHSPGEPSWGRRHLRAGPGGALAAARGVSCRAEPRRVEPSRPAPR